VVYKKREQGIGNREQRTGNREWGIGNKEQERTGGKVILSPASLPPVMTISAIAEELYSLNDG
jgi:hypothetical protein